MRKNLAVGLAGLMLAGCASGTPGPRATLPAGDELAARVMRVSGAQHWGKVARLRFTFNVVDDGKTVMSAAHDWDVVAGKNTVTVNGKSVTVPVSAAPAEWASTEVRRAYARWVNDSYWLLMPTKLFDGGVTRTLMPPESIENVKYEVLELSFAGVGLTPGDRYRLYVSPQTGYVRYWDYMPQPGKSARFSWEDYRAVGPLMLAHKHQEVGGKRQIVFSDVSVETR
jgi:hypothetical protein